MADPLFTFSGHEVFRTEDGGLSLLRKGAAQSYPLVDVDVVEALLAERDRLRGIVQQVIAYRCPVDPTWECAMQMGEYQRDLKEELGDAV